MARGSWMADDDCTWPATGAEQNTTEMRQPRVVVTVAVVVVLVVDAAAAVRTAAAVAAALGLAGALLGTAAFAATRGGLVVAGHDKYSLREARELRHAGGMTCAVARLAELAAAAAPRLRVSDAAICRNRENRKSGPFLRALRPRYRPDVYRVPSLFFYLFSVFSFSRARLCRYDYRRRYRYVANAGGSFLSLFLSLWRRTPQKKKKMKPQKNQQMSQIWSSFFPSLLVIPRLPVLNDLFPSFDDRRIALFPFATLPFALLVLQFSRLSSSFRWIRSPVVSLYRNCIVLHCLHSYRLVAERGYERQDSQSKTCTHSAWMGGCMYIIRKEMGFPELLGISPAIIAQEGEVWRTQVEEQEGAWM